MENIKVEVQTKTQIAEFEFNNWDDAVKFCEVVKLGKNVKTVSSYKEEKPLFPLIDKNEKQLIQLLELFSPIVFESIEELNKKIEELNIKVDEWGKPYDRLRSLAGYRYRVENIKSALYYLKMKRLSGEELEVFSDQDFKEIKKDFYTWKNGNISALFVIEFVD